MFVKIRDFIKFEGFSCGIPREQAILRKSKTPRKSPEKWTFLSLAFYNAPSLHTANEHLFPQNYRYRYRLGTLINSFNCH